MTTPEAICCCVLAVACAAFLLWMGREMRRALDDDGRDER